MAAFPATNSRPRSSALGGDTPASANQVDLGQESTMQQALRERCQDNQVVATRQPSSL